MRSDQAAACRYLTCWWASVTYRGIQHKNRIVVCPRAIVTPRLVLDMRENPVAARGVLGLDIEHLKISGHEAKVAAIALRLPLPSAVTEYPVVDDLDPIGGAVIVNATGWPLASSAICFGGSPIKREFALRPARSVAQERY
jgi:hypothetical protein